MWFETPKNLGFDPQKWRSKQEDWDFISNNLHLASTHVDDLDFVSKPRHETETDKKNVADGCWLCLANPVHFYDLRITIFFRIGASKTRLQSCEVLACFSNFSSHFDV